MPTLAVAVRWIHLVGASLLVGVFAFLVLVGRPAARAAGPRAWTRFAALDARLVALGLAALGAAVASGLLDLWRQVTVATGIGFRESLALEPLAALLGQTRYGTVWLVRHGLLTLLGALLVFREEERDPADWLALRLEGGVLAAASLGIVGAAGHAASAPQSPAAAIAVDAAHLLATGVWFGGLIPLALFLRWSLALPDGSDGTVAAATATRRFSALGLAGVTLLVVTGAYNAWGQVTSVPALFGTPYGRWLCLKLALLLPLLGVASLNLVVLGPRLVQATRRDAAAADRRLVQRLGARVLAEVALGAAILGVVAVLGLTTPARHAAPTWPLSFRFAWEATKDLPGVQTRVAIGSQLTLLGLVAAFLAVIVKRRRWGWVLTAGIAGVAAGLAVALPALAVDAYPTTYLRPTVPYTAASITQGQALYRTHCATCHGVAGYGDGPVAATLRPRPADLSARHTADHTVGDLFWWVTNGIPRSSMPGFGDRLSPAERWDAINFLRTLAASEQARVLGPVAVPAPSLVAPDLAYTTGVGEGRALKDHRGQNIVLLVFFSVPGSLDRLAQLSHVYRDVRGRGGEILGIPFRPARGLYRTLWPRPIFFPIVVDGAAEAAAAYTLFRRDLTPEGQRPEPPTPVHMELLVDRQGYLRARWISEGAGGWAPPGRLLAEIERLAGEETRAPVPDEHVH